MSRPRLSELRAIIFDLDGLMADTEPLHMLAFNLVLQAAHVPHQYDRKEYGEKFVGITLQKNAEDVCEQFALPQSPDDIVRAQRALFSLLISDVRNVKPMPGLCELLDFVEQRGLTKAVASGSQQDEVEKILRGLGVTERFPHVVSGTGMRPKPDPEIYLTALGRLGASPAHTLALEDSNAGVRAAQAAGLRVIAVPSEFTRHQSLTEADLITDSLTDVIFYLSRD